MSNVVDFRGGNARPRRSVPVSPGEARILLFTGVRYCRESEVTVPAPTANVSGSKIRS